jgi:hypothetical protein
MSRLHQYRYVGTPDPMNEREAYQCNKYLKRKRLSLLTVGRFLVDAEALLTPIHLDCFNCRAVHRESCCNGQPYAVESWQIPLLELEALEIAERFMPEREQERVRQGGIWEQGKSAGTIRVKHDSCVFYNEIDGKHGCSIHAHAERSGQPVYPIKPFSCQLYPLDLIEVGDQVLVTALNEETAPFSRWGTEYLDHFLCANLDRRRLAKHLDPSLFAIEGYRPAFQWGVPFLRHVLGVQAAETVERMMSEKLEQQEP